MNGKMAKFEGASETQEDSEEATQNRKLMEKRIHTIINQLRQDAREYLTPKDTVGEASLEEMPLQKICQKLRNSKRYRKKREVKASEKGMIETLELTAEQVRKDIDELDRKLRGSTKSQEELERIVGQYEQIHGIDKRLNNEIIDKSASEIDSIPLNQKSFDLQNVLFNFMGIDGRGQKFRKLGDKRDIFGKIVKIP